MKLLQLTLRDLLWLVLVAAMMVGWWLDHRERQAQITALAIQWLQERDKYSEDWDIYVLNAAK